MSTILTDSTNYDNIADAIRSKTGSSTTYKPREMSAAILSIPTGMPIEISTAAAMDAVLIAANVGKVYKFIGTTDQTYTNGDLYVVEAVGSGAYRFIHYGEEPPASHPWLCFTAEQANSTISMDVEGTPTKGQSFETSFNGITWNVFTPGTTTITLANIGDKVYFRGDNETVSEPSSVNYKYNITGRIAASGNIMSLLDKTCSRVDVPAHCFNMMFHSQAYLTTPPELPATTLGSNCYQRMFQNCFRLTTAPALPATILADTCYEGMFLKCTSLTTPPALPATTLAEECYELMFKECTSLTSVPTLPATTLVYGCYNYMFDGCTSLYVSDTSGTGYSKAWKIPTTGTASGFNYEMTSMFRECLGTRSTNSPNFNGVQKTYYTQNVPLT